MGPWQDRGVSCRGRGSVRALLLTRLSLSTGKTGTKYLPRSHRGCGDVRKIKAVTDLWERIEGCADICDSTTVFF